MQIKIFLKNILPVTILLISISSILPWCSLPIGNTFIWWLLQFFILYSFFYLKNSHYSIRFVKCWLLYLVVSFFYGAFFMTELYWDWKLLVNNFMIFSLPLVVYLCYDSKTLYSILRFWFTKSWIILIVLFPFLQSDAFGRFLVPYTFLALFIPHLNKKFIFFTILAFSITIIFGNESRSDLLKFIVCLFLGLSSYFHWIWKRKRFIYFISKTLFLLPFVLFILGITNTFNIFKIEEELGLDNDKFVMNNAKGDEHSALIDTRTFLYAEELQSAINNNYVFWGRSLARGYDSPFFGDWANHEFGNNRGERPSCEVSILNIFNYMGLVGIIFYFLLFYKAVRLAICNSNNLFIPIIGVYIAFRWLFAWVEDFSRFDLNYLFLWILIGICYSPSFRNMNNIEFTHWLKKIVK